LASGDTYLYRVLYVTGAHLDPPLEDDRTPLHEAVWRGHSKMVSMLLRDSSCFHTDKNAKDSAGRTALHYAVMKDNPDITAILLKYSLDIGARDASHKTAYDLAMELQGPCADELIDMLCARESRIAALQDPCRKDSAECEPTKLKLTDNTTTEELNEASHTANLLEVALRETGVPMICSDELSFFEAINVGSSCVVYRAKWRGITVAVKQFKLEYRQSSKELHKFIAEMRVLAQIRHPHLLLLMGTCIDQPQLCIVTEYVQNCTLFTVLHRSPRTPLSLADRYKIALQLGQGLLYLHSNDPPIVHRDLKPENILLDAMFNVKIADFGLARPLTRFQGDEQTTTCIGTTRFMAPELFDKTKSIGTGVDIWAFGCVLIELFSNKRPWEYITSAKVNHIYYELFHKKPIPIPASIPQCLQAVIRKCCEYSPRERLRCQELVSSLELCRSDLELEVVKES
jgi:tRNA A-37 threonylcarbamoyl transferase component Bud32